MKCTYCKRDMIKGHGGGLEPTRDHVIPQSKGGRKTVPCCARCNHLKADLMPDAWEWFMTNNPLWWTAKRKGDLKHPKVQMLSKSLVPTLSMKPAMVDKRAEAERKLAALRADPAYKPVQPSYEDPIAQLAYEMAMQNPRNRVGHVGAVKCGPAALRSMTAEENARRMREYWIRISAEDDAQL